jgi:hypothetical protein
MPSNLDHNPDMFVSRETVRIYKNYPYGSWVVNEDGVEYPVFAVVGGYTWCVLNTEFEMVLEDNFKPFTFHVWKNRIASILDPHNKVLDEFIFSLGSPHVKLFVKRRMLDDQVDEICIDKRWDRQLYGNGNNDLTAQQKYLAERPATIY